MPVTAKLSKKFYETLGDEIANELVGWLNDVDATYRTELRELNELNFSRFDAKLEQRLAELELRWERRLAERDVRSERRFADLENKLGDMKNELLRWIIGLFAPTGLAMLGLVVALITMILRR
jgi:hypothetical protein